MELWNRAPLFTMDGALEQDKGSLICFLLRNGTETYFVQIRHRYTVPVDLICLDLIDLRF